MIRPCVHHLQGQSSVISVALKTPLESDWEPVFIKLHFCIDPMTILVSHQAVPPHFTTKLRPCLLSTSRTNVDIAVLSSNARLCVELYSGLI